MKTRSIKSFATSEDGRLTPDMITAFERDGVIVLQDFVSVSDCHGLRRQALKLIDDLDPGSVKSIFSAMEQTQLGDKYFEESGDKIRFFFEQDAFDKDGNFVQSKEDSLNKMGHAMHDLDPVVDEFSRSNTGSRSQGIVAVIDECDPNTELCRVRRRSPDGGDDQCLRARRCDHAARFCVCSGVPAAAREGAGTRRRLRCGVRAQHLFSD